MKLDLLDDLAAAPPLARKLAQIREGAEPVVFEHVAEAAQPFLAAILVRQVKQRLWLVCADVRSQETMHNELLNWFPDALFFPEMERAAFAGAVADPETTAERLVIVQKLSDPKNRQPIVLTKASLTDNVPTPATLKAQEVWLRPKARLDRQRLIAQLAEAGYERVAQVSARRQFAVRGGILDIFSLHHALPIRVELFDEEIESLREFDLDTQTSVRAMVACTLLLGEVEQLDCALRDYLGARDVTVDVNAGFVGARVAIREGAMDSVDGMDGMDAAAPPEFIPSIESISSIAPEDYSTAFFDHGLGEFEAGDFVVDELKRERFFNQLREWREQGWETHVFCNNEGEIERLRELVPPVEQDALRFTVGTLARGFTCPAAKVAVLSDAELFGRYRNTRARRLALRRAREQAGRAQIDFSELNEDDLVVHLEHGIGRYEGMRAVPGVDGREEQVLVVVFASDARLYVPVEQSYLLSRYVGVGRQNPPLSTLGDGKWSKAKANAEKAVFDYAARLLSVHAERETAAGFAFPPDNKWQREFESSFLYKETPDQLNAIAAVKTDMEGEQPMDRLICGDVGFGKTEVAIRAAFKAVMGGRQVAVLVPTTVLAQQHYHNFRERMSDYPVTVEVLSRFRTPAEQRKAVAAARDGTADIIVGTHRLLSKDISFKNLGLVVIDEEQRFGVLHKERFKEMFKLVDMITLSATPIPRTLYLSLMGAKDMSTIETPPLNRIPVETLICPYDERIIRDAITRELARQGQVYFLHNRVQSIEKVRDRIAKLCPKARLVIGHGQMNEHELEDVMQQFVSGEADVLISTTIIESGLDIPNANTIIIDRADRFGLADLYQLRGRVGRAQHKAYAYLMLPRDMMTLGEARKRINAIKQYSSLGAGFKIAMRDLEIRGAGNILGTAQSGHIVNIGFDLYCSLLKQAVAKLKGEKVRSRLEVVLRLDFVALREAEWRGKNDENSAPSSSVIRHSSFHCPAFLPVSYIAEAQPRIQAYRRLAEVATQEALDALCATWRDRFGPLPQPVANLLMLTEIKLSAAARKVSIVEVKEDKVMLTRHGDFIQIGGKFPRVSASDPNERLREVLRLIRAL
jgi:transcription-repair coupling factor (superfamily II helicase)